MEGRLQRFSPYLYVTLPWASLLALPREYLLALFV
jgi:hypothetical protein